MAETGRLSAPPRAAPSWVREHPVTALRIAIIVTVLLVLGGARALRAALPRRGAVAVRDRPRALSRCCAIRPSTSHLYTTFYEIGIAHGDRRRERACGRHRARRLEADAARLRAVPLLSRPVPEDHLLPGDDHVVRRRPRLEDRHGRDLLLLPGGAQCRRRHARDRQGADPRRPELPRQHLADGDQDLHAGDAPPDHQRHAARARRLPDRHAAGRNQAVEPRRRLPGDPGLHAVRHAADVFAADRAVRDRDRRQCADRPPRRARRHQACRDALLA